MCSIVYRWRYVSIKCILCIKIRNHSHGDQGTLARDHLWISCKSTSYIFVLFWWRCKIECVSWKKMAACNRPLMETFYRALFQNWQFNSSHKQKIFPFKQVFLLVFTKLVTDWNKDYWHVTKNREFIRTYEHVTQRKFVFKALKVLLMLSFL